MGRESTLAKRTAIYAVGNFGSKVLAYVMVLVYSYYITAEDLGYYDIILTTISMLQPLALFQINDAVYRYLVEAVMSERETIIGNGIKFLCCTTAAAECILLAINAFIPLNYVVWIGALLASTMFFVFLQDTIRGLGKSKMYASMGVLNSIIMLICEAIGLIVFRLGVVALLISKVIANTVCCIIMAVRVAENRQALRHPMKAHTLLPLLQYAAPLVPNAVSWWVVNSSDRYIIAGFLGTEYNGIFSIANKFPTILTTITSIFYLAWQESAIREYDSPNRDQFFSEIFRKYYVLLFSLCLCAIPATRFVIEIFVAAEYKSAWQYTSFLYLGAVFSALCSFLGMGYQISKETSRSLSSTIFAAFLNVIVNVGLVKAIALHAASFSTFVAYLFLFLIRWRHAKRYVSLHISWPEFLLLFGSAVLMMVITSVMPNVWLCSVLCAFSAAVILYMNRAILKPIVKRFLQSGKQRGICP